MSTRRGSREPQERREALGRAIQSLRAERGLKRARLAQAAGISYSHLAEIEAGKKGASGETLESIAEALGVPTHRLWMVAEAVAQEIMGASPVVAATGDPRRAAPAPAAFEGYALNAPGVARRAQEPSGSRIGELLGLASRLDDEDVEQLIGLARRLRRKG